MRSIISAACVALVLGISPPGWAREPGLRLENQHLAIQFAPEEAGMGVVLLEHRSGGGTPEMFVAASPADATVWQVAMHRAGSTNKWIFINNTNACRRTARIDAAAGTAALQWEGIAVGDEKGVLDVTVSIRLPPDSPASLWKISVTNRSAAMGVWQVYLPLFRGFGATGAVDIAAPSGNSGILVKGATNAFSGIYPSGGWPMQFFLAGKGDRGLLFAMRDPEAWLKRYYVHPRGECLFNIYAPDSGKPGVGFETPLELCIEAYRGSWWTGAKRYRAWAAMAPWTKRGPIATRRDYPSALRRTALWWQAINKPVEAVAREMKAAASCCDVPMAVHWYSWHKFPFDVNYPEYFPPQPGFAGRAREIVAAGHTVMPYMNGRLWDLKGPQFPAAQPWTCKKENGTDIYVENYGTAGGNINCAVMCPATRFWQQKVRENVQRLWTGCGVNAVYLDQIASMVPVQCFDPTHGHPLGGGSFWAQGYRDMLRPLADEAASKGFFLTSEDTCEAFIDTLDGFLTWGPPRPEQEIPLMSAVYSGYTVYFGSPCASSPDTFFRIQGRDLLWGRQPGWMELNRFVDATNMKEDGTGCSWRTGDAAEYLLACARYRKALERFLLEGELLGELQLLEPPPPEELPPVVTAVWRAPDGRVALLLANVTGEMRTAEYEFDGSQWGIAAPSAKLGLARIHPEKKEDLGEAALKLRRKDTLAPRQILALELTPR